MISRGRATHSDRLERWLGKDHVESISKQFADFYWPVPVHGVPGNVFVMPGGDFAGEIKVGQFMSKYDGAALTIQKIKKRIDATVRRDKGLLALADLLHAEERHHASIGAFASIDAVIAAWKAGKGQTIRFNKTGVATFAAGNCNDLWVATGVPAAGAAGADAPGGTAHSASNTGALPFKSLGAANGSAYLNWALNSSVAGNSLLMYDRLFSVAITVSALTLGGSEGVTGVPTRYQSTTPGDIDFCGGSFIFPLCTTTLGAFAHIWGPNIEYINQANEAGGQVGYGSGVFGITSCPAGVIDIHATTFPNGSQWFFPLASGGGGPAAIGSYGVKNLTLIGTNAVAITTGRLSIVQAYPIAIQGCPIANLACVDDGLYTSLAMTPIMDDACLSFLELPKPSTSASTYAGVVRTVGE